ncbi:hypothetical protein CAPTEDRAFT_191363, partial [Capitella teleta]
MLSTLRIIRTVVKRGSSIRHLRPPVYSCKQNERDFSVSTSPSSNIQSSPFETISIPDRVPLPHHIMAKFPRRTFTFNQLQTAIAKVDSALVKQGFKKGDVITIFSPNCPEFGVMYLTVTTVGGVVRT